MHTSTDPRRVPPRTGTTGLVRHIPRRARTVCTSVPVISIRRVCSILATATPHAALLGREGANRLIPHSLFDKKEAKEDFSLTISVSSSIIYSL